MKTNPVILKSTFYNMIQIFSQPKKAWTRVQNGEISSNEFWNTMLIFLCLPLVFVLAVNILYIGSVLSIMFKTLLYSAIVLLIYSVWINLYLKNTETEILKIFENIEWKSLIEEKSTLMAAYFLIPLVTFNIIETIIFFLMRNLARPLLRIVYLVVLVYCIYMLYLGIKTVMGCKTRKAISVTTGIVVLGCLGIGIVYLILSPIGWGGVSNFWQYFF
ncbi:YIP1 family protein [candidate division KSB1 bacterium]|nr:YIP1 family protein [candidate division KSB1 bacterium]